MENFINERCIKKRMADDCIDLAAAREARKQKSKDNKGIPRTKIKPPSYTKGSHITLEKRILAVPPGFADPEIKKPVLFLPYDRNTAIRTCTENPYFEELSRNSCETIPLMPEVFPEYKNPNPEAEPLFNYRRERSLLLHMLRIADTTMCMNNYANTGILVIDPRYSRDIANIADESISLGRNQFITSFEAKDPQRISLVNQYIEELQCEREAVPRYRIFTRQRITGRIHLLMSSRDEIFQRFPMYQQFTEECTEYTCRAAEETASGQYNQHSPLSRTRDVKKKNRPSHLRLVK